MDGFFLLPLRLTITGGELQKWGNDTLAVLVVLIAHENSNTRLACPTQARIAALAGISKTTVGGALDSLARLGWLTTTVHPTRRGLGFYQKHHMKYARHRNGDKSGKWLHIERYIVANGIWAAMPPDTRRLYLTLLALSWGGYGTPASYEEDVTTYACVVPAPEDGRFVDAGYLSPQKLRDMAGITQRTFTRAWNWLVDAKMIVGAPDGMRETENYESKGGIMLTYNSSLQVPAVLERVARAKADIAKLTPGAKRLMTRTCKAIGQGDPKGHKSTVVERTPTPLQSDISVPKEGLEVEF